FYRVATDQVLEVVRVLHDSMDLDQHLPRNR
ncbi:type II toxin-antitoxin system RelE/ParE family toxin, partial [Pseudomonas aeruginosa]